MADYTAKWRIAGENGMQTTFRSILGDAKATADRMNGHFRTIGNVFRGGAIVGAFVGFERLAESAEKAALAAGDKGTAQALRQLNAEIDKLKSKGTNLIGQVLGEAFINFRGTELQKAEQDIKALHTELERLLQSSGGRRDIPGIVERERQLAELEARAAAAAPAGPSAPLGSFARTRAVNRGGGSRQLVETIDPKAEAAAAKAAEEAARAAAEALKAQADAYAEVYKAGFAAMQGLESAAEQQIRLYHEQKFALEELAATYPNLAEQAQAALQALEVSGLEDIQITARHILPEREVAQMSVFAEEAARNMQGHFAEFFYSFDGGLKGMVGNFADALHRMVAELMAQQALTAFFTWGQGFFGGGVGNFFGDMASAIKPKALGGPVTGGSPYLVGERGPELFVPGASGSIVPNHALAGAGGVNLTVAPVYNVDARGATMELARALPGILKASEQRTVAQVRELVARGRLS